MYCNYIIFHFLLYLPPHKLSYIVLLTRFQIHSFFPIIVVAIIYLCVFTCACVCVCVCKYIPHKYSCLNLYDVAYMYVYRFFTYSLTSEAYPGEVYFYSSQHSLVFCVYDWELLGFPQPSLAHLLSVFISCLGSHVGKTFCL